MDLPAPAFRRALGALDGGAAAGAAAGASSSSGGGGAGGGMEEDLATVLATHYYAAHGDTGNVEVVVRKMILSCLSLPRRSINDQ